MKKHVKDLCVNRQTLLLFMEAWQKVCRGGGRKILIIVNRIAWDSEYQRPPLLNVQFNTKQPWII